MAKQQISPRNPEVQDFVKWLATKFGVGSEVYNKFIQKISSDTFSWPPKRDFLFWNDLDWGKYYTTYKSQQTTTDSLAGKTYTLNKDKSPWEQLGIDEETFKKKYPDLYKQAVEYANGTSAEPTTSLLWGGYTDKDLQEAADRLGISVDALKKNILSKQFNIGGTNDEITTEQWMQIHGADQANAQAQLQQVLKQNLSGYSEQLAQGLQRAQTDEQSIYAKAWEDAKNNILGSLAPTEWASKYLVSSAKNPYKKEQEDTGLQIESLKAQQDLAKISLDNLNKRLNDMTDSTYLDPMTASVKAGLEATIQKTKEDIALLKTGWAGGSVEAAREYAQKYGYLTKEPYKENVDKFFRDRGMTAPEGISGDYGRAIDEAQRYITNPDSPEFSGMSMEQKQELGILAQNAGLYGSPPKPEPTLDIPDFLAPVLSNLGTGTRYASAGGVYGGVQTPETVYQVKGTNPSKWASPITPSGQMLNTWNPTQRSMFENYVTTQGSSTPSDLYWNASIMQPKSLRLGSTWSPAKRR